TRGDLSGGDHTRGDLSGGDHTRGDLSGGDHTRGDLTWGGIQGPAFLGHPQPEPFSVCGLTFKVL
ncbi:MAG: hypothetical protein LBJ61_06660, partial [Deltaproteobacteria bacterium]|nr:hypothetical protein [Deltaproteobacteria bacterium]